MASIWLGYRVQHIPEVEWLGHKTAEMSAHSIAAREISLIDFESNS